MGSWINEATASAQIAAAAGGIRGRKDRYQSALRNARRTRHGGGIAAGSMEWSGGDHGLLTKVVPDPPMHATHIAAVTVAFALFVCHEHGAEAQAALSRPAAGLSTEHSTATRGRLQEVIVTANRREQSNQHVPLAITAITASTAARIGVTDAQSLADLIPGLNFNRQANASIPFLRGIGTPVGQAGDEPSVALYIDDIYMPAGSASISNFNDIDRIEVEKGPQGTLFGRNATGGVVQVFTRDPSSRPEFEARVGYGNYDTWSADSYATGPLSENLLANVAAYWSDQAEGWGRNVTNGAPTFRSREHGGRIKFLWTPTARTSVLLSLDFDRTASQEGVGFAAWPGTGSLDPLPPFPNGGFAPATGYYDLRENFNSDGENRQAGESLRLTQDFAWSRLVSISAYRDTRGDYLIDQDLGPLPIVNIAITTEETTYTQEFQLLSVQKSRISWIAGLFYLNDKAGFEPLHFTGAAFAALPFVDAYGIQNTQSWAAFAQGTATILPDTHLTAGARYTDDDRTMRAGAVFAGAPFSPASNSPQSKSWSSPTWRLILDHSFTPDIMGYVGYNRGFKSGLFNAVVLAGSPIDPPVNPEKLDAYTAGLKSEFLGHRLRINLEGFYYDYKNIQVEEILSGVSHITNAARATIKGIDLDISAVPANHLTLTLDLEGMQGKYDSFRDGTFYVYNPVTGGNCVLAVAAPPAPLPCGGAATPPQYNPLTGHWNLKGNHTIQTPPFSASMVAQYDIPTQVGLFDVNLSWSHSGNYFASPDNGEGQIPPSSSRNTMQKLLNLFNGSLGWGSTSGVWEARLWVKNLTNVKYWSENDLQAFATQYSPAPPRTYGFTATVRFE